MGLNSENNMGKWGSVDGKLLRGNIRSKGEGFWLNPLHLTGFFAEDRLGGPDITGPWRRMRNSIRY